MSLPEKTLEDEISFALSYPFPRPEGSFVFRYSEKGEGVTEAIPDWSTYLQDEKDATGIRRIAVLAIGSNASPLQLQRKYGDMGESGSVVVVPGRLPDYDVVYCPLIARYGSIPATLYYQRGVEVDIHVTYLTMGQLEIMLTTEGGYHICKCNNLNMKLLGDQILSKAFVFLAKNGELRNSSGHPIPLAEVPGSGRVGLPMTQSEVHCFVSDILETTAKEFVVSVLTIPSTRKEYNSRLSLTVPKTFQKNSNIAIIDFTREDLFQISSWSEVCSPKKRC